MNRTLKQQRIIYFSSLAVCLALILLGESNVFVDFQTPPDSLQTFTLEIVAIFATLGALPIAVKMKRSAKLCLVPLCFAIVLVCYYLTLSTYLVLCLAIVAFALVYIFPKKAKGELSNVSENKCRECNEEGENKEE